jgi:putative ABC transport system permease protein
MGMRLIAGRAFDPVRRDGVQEALIDRRLAARFFPTGEALGAQIPWPLMTPASPPVPPGVAALTIVGIVEPARQYDIHQDGRPQLFIRTEDWGFRPLSFVVRTGRDPRSLLPEVQAAIRQVDTRVAVGDPRTMEEIVGELQRQPQTSALLIAAFALGALLLAAMGLFGVVSGSVTRRRHELAVRLALGADHARVLRLVVGEGARLVGLGVLIGLPGIYVAGRLLRGMLTEISPADPLTLAIVSLGLGLVTMLACYLPARRVAAIAPVQSLRQE